MEIRRATLSDVPGLAVLNGQVQALHVQAEPNRYRPTVAADIEGQFRELVARSDIEILMAIVGDEAVGYAVMQIVRHTGHLYILPHGYVLVDQLGVAPSSQRRGVGRALMNAVHERATELGIDRIELDVRAHNRAAISFYEGLGYGLVAHRMARGE